ncbi:response regulator transcription factor [Dyella dinghuensis]|uniref:response regulator transcription factor n=1 Tax=Dyella dinghuensis TaxID=1920169 RepID=UPI001F48BF0F|nr:response regulator transcription factor [Dyella dinghuensis]
MSSQSPLKVLILEDDDLLRDRVLVPHLQQFGFRVEAIGRASELEAKLRQQVPDIVVLDLGLPDLDGFEVARNLRAGIAGIGIVMLTARAERHHQVRGLSEGADAYLSKPVDIDVLAATLYSLARRLQLSSPSQNDHSWRLGADGWCLLSPTGQPVALSQLESRLLAPLIEAPNRVVSREALIQAVTSNVHNYDPHRLDTLVHRIRKKVMRVLGMPFPLNAVPGQGYVLVSH